VSGADFFDVLPVRGRALLAAAGPNWARPVPDCPDWDGAGLLRQTGGSLSMPGDLGDKIRWYTMQDKQRLASPQAPRW
jgi:hypothetical protein